MHYEIQSVHHQIIQLLGVTVPAHQSISYQYIDNGAEVLIAHHTELELQIQIELKSEHGMV